ncbi:CHAP domain-containing protein [Nocardioides sp. SYSU DS0663]|uniref:CHAP domain-containing protein n=1 Tax=Nocardioides sp. SYSU DS0663 TaxID=3416445 RepID=UPI003F4C209A
MPHPSQPSRPHQPPARRRVLAAVVLLLGSVLTGVTISPAAPASAGSTYLCKGYAGCRDAGYSNAGYQAASKQMFWRMYAGHNCTNYVAYRMVRSGMPNTRPWDGGGNAEHWGRQMASITDQTPMVGAVAWWKANVPGAGSSGHVAYVEQVVSNREIIVSEDSWGGDFSWRRITKDGTGWPSGFIHFNDATVVNDQPPAVVGTPAVGRAVTADVGSWQPSATYKYQWLVAGKAVAGATTASFTPTASHLNKRLRVKITAKRNGYVATSARSAAGPTVSPGDLQQLSSPVITGTAEVDQPLTVSRPEFAPAAGTQSVQWLADGKPIAGATGWTLVLGQEQIGTAVAARVTSGAVGYREVTLESAPTARVVAGTIEVRTPFEIRGKRRVGRTLTAVAGEYTPADAQVTHTWLRDGEPIPGADGPTYVLRPGDVGRRIGLQVALRAPHYRSVTRTVRSEERVVTKSQLVLRAKGRPGRAVVVVRVKAPGVPQPAGSVVVRIGGRTVEAPLARGRARVLVPGLRAGEKRVRVVYAGDELVRGSRGATTVEVAPR